MEFKMNNKKPTPFDDYEARKEKREAELKVSHVSDTPNYMTKGSAFFLLSLILTCALKCETVIDFLVWFAAVFILSIFWCFTIRFLMDKMPRVYAVTVNTLYVSLAGLGFTIFKSWINVKLGSMGFPDLIISNLSGVYDMYYLTPMILGFSAFLFDSGNGTNEFLIGKHFMRPLGICFAVTLITAAVSRLLGITKGFLGILILALLLILLSLIRTAIVKHGVYFSYPDFGSRAIISTSKELLRSFVFSKLKLTLAAIVSFVATSSIIYFAGTRFDMHLQKYAFLITSVIMMIFCCVFENKSPMMFLFDYPLVAMLLSVPYEIGITVPMIPVYCIAVIIADVCLSAFVFTINRRLLFADISAYVKGVPLILIYVSLILMVGTVTFVLI